MSDKQATLTMRPDVMRFLDEVTKQYQLHDAAKAVRCLVNYARDNPDKHHEIFAEIRCTSC